jgi:alpha-galactosidase/6-phospho-beta-glucosidase family protein
MVKICIVGAGSAAFWLSWTRDLCVMKSAPGSTITLVDINKERLTAAYDVATRYAKELGVQISFEKTDNRREALKGADYVLNTAFGGHDYTEKMRRIGEKNGYYRGIDSVEFNFVSDYYTILSFRQYQLALDIASDMEEICPEAYLCQIANPIFEVTTLLQRQRSKIKTVGFCDGYIGIYRLMAAIGLSPADADFHVAGLNHCVWLTRLRNKRTGEDCYPLIDKWVANESQNYWNTHDLSIWEETLSPASVDMYKIYGLYPIGDTTRSFSWKYHYDLETSKRWFGPLGGTDSEVGTLVRLDRFQRNAERLMELANNPNAKLSQEIPPFKGANEYSDFIDAVELGEEKRLVLNIPNNGIMTQLPGDLTVEVPVVVSKGGRLSPERPDPLPKRLMDFVIIPRMLHAEWGLEAFTSGSREMLVENLIRDPRTRSERQARGTIDEILALPGNEDMAAHYR